MPDEQNQEPITNSAPQEPVDAFTTDEGIAPEIDLAAEVAEQKDRVLRLQAELQNLRNRQARELADARRYGSIDLMRDILPTVDNIGRAIEMAEKSEDSQNLLEGFKLVQQQMLATLSQHGCTEIAAEGEVFDPCLHQAIQQMPSADVPAGQIMIVTQTGYQLHDRVVRAAQVIVSAGPVASQNIAATDSSGEDQTA